MERPAAYRAHMNKRVTSGKDIRCRHCEELKQELVERSLEPGASVAAIAQEHGINANLLFNWRRLRLMNALLLRPQIHRWQKGETKFFQKLVVLCRRLSDLSLNPHQLCVRGRQVNLHFLLSGADVS